MTTEIEGPVLGALGSSTSSDGVIDTYEYDAMARPFARSRLVDGRLLRFETGLDDFGRELTTSYPDSLGLGVTTVRNTYDDDSGEVNEVQVNGSTVWRLEEQSAHGMPTRETLGSGVLGVIDRVSSYSVGGRLELLSSISAPTVLQSLVYAHDERGLLERRTDGITGRTETFEHDDLGRLERVLEGATVTQSYVSDAIGNLTNTHDGTIVYGDPARPYAATELDGPEGGHFGYDDVGNVYQAGELTITYTQRNLPRTVSSSKVGLIEYRYDAAGARATKRGRDVDVTYFGLYELERRGMLLYERLSISTPVGVIAQVERRGATPGDQTPAVRLRWLLADRQGSVETTWASGEDPEHHRYDAYGGVLAESGATTGERPSPTVSQGYTGHEHEDEVGLVNMGGRIYSPRLRRFLSADPIVAVPFGQGLNAYTYVMGDPMNWTDPSGWQAALVDSGFVSRSETGTGEYSPRCVEGGRCTYSEGEGREDARAGDGSASERPGAGAIAQAPALPSDDGPVMVDMSGIEDLMAETLPGMTPEGNVANFYEASRSAQFLSEELYSRTTPVGQMSEFARASAQFGAEVSYALLPLAASLVPGVDELYNGGVLSGAIDATEGERLWAAGESYLSAVTLGAAPSRRGIIRTLGRLARVGDVIPYGTIARGFERHHGVMDAWAEANIIGYLSRRAPAVVMTAAQHNATRAVFNRWRAARGWSRTPVPWQQVSRHDMHRLALEMFDAADVPRDVQSEYFAQFARYVSEVE